MEILSNLDSSDSARIGAVIAVGIARRTDLLDRVLEVLGQSTPESDLALACTIALGDIAGDHDRSLPLLARQLKHGKNPFLAHLALLKLGSDAALDIALESLAIKFDERMAVNLAMRDHTRRGAIALLASEIAASHGSLLLDHKIVLPLAYLEDAAMQQVIADEAVRQSLRETALAEEGVFAGSRLRAVRAIGLFDPQTAFLSAQKALEEQKHFARTAYPSLLLEMDAVRAVPVLIRQCLDDVSTAVRRAISRAR